MGYFGTIIRYIGIQSKKVENYFSKNLKYLRKRESLDLDELGRILGKGKSVVNGYENGKTEPPLSVCYKVVRHFGIDLPLLVEKDLERDERAAYRLKEPSVDLQMVAEPESEYLIPNLKLTQDDFHKLMQLAKELPDMIPPKKKK